MEPTGTVGALFGFFAQIPERNVHCSSERLPLGSLNDLFIIWDNHKCASINRKHNAKMGRLLRVDGTFSST
jgi:hypothetical protein